VFFFDDKSLLKYSGVTGRFLAYSRAAITADTAILDFRAAYAANAAAYAAATNANAAFAVAFCAATSNAFAFDITATITAAIDTAYLGLHAATADANVVFTAAPLTAAAFRAEAAVYAANSARERVKPFESFESIADAALSAQSIVCAPIYLMLLSLREVVFFIRAIASLVMSEEEPDVESVTEAAQHLVEASELLLAAVVSPIVNAVDFAGSSVVTLEAIRGDERRDHVRP